MTNLDSILKSSDIILLTKVHLVKAVSSSGHVWMWEWTIKKAKHQRIDAFQLWCWRRHLRMPWTTRRSNQSILKEISPELEGLMLKLQYFGHLMHRANSLEKTLMLGKIEAGQGEDRGWDGWMASPTQWTWVRANAGRWWWREKPGMLQSTGLQRIGRNWATEQQQHLCFCTQKVMIIRSFETLIKRWKIQLRLIFPHILNTYPGKKFSLQISHVADVSKLKQSFWTLKITKP